MNWIAGDRFINKDQSDWYYNRARAAALWQAMLEAGPCPNCGAPPDIDMVETSPFGGPLTFTPGEVICSIRCFEREPDAYRKAIHS